MKYKQKIEKEIELEIEAGDIVEWKDSEEIIWAVVTKTDGIDGIEGMAFRDNRTSVYKIPHSVFFNIDKFLYKLRKVPKPEFKKWADTL